MLRGVSSPHRFLGNVGKCIRTMGLNSVSCWSLLASGGPVRTECVSGKCGRSWPVQFDLQQLRSLSYLAMDKKIIQTKTLMNKHSTPPLLNNVHSDGTVEETARRYYTPRNIVEQIVDTYPEETFRQTQRLLSRKLGGIEYMYNMYTSQGTDIACLSTTVESVYPILPKDAEKAWTLLLQRHPLLRMRIVNDESCGNGHLHFVENDPLEYDFRVAGDDTNWLQYMLQELKTPFLKTSRSLIRLRLFRTVKTKPKTSSVSSLKTNECYMSYSPDHTHVNDTFQYRTRFVFIMHHSVMDGGYSLWMFQELMNFLDAVVLNVDLKVRELPLLPPMEEYFRETLESQAQHLSNDDGNTTDSSLRFCHKSLDDTVLKQYNKTFQNDIETTPNQVLSNGCHVFKYTKSDSRTFIQACKSRGCSPKGAFTTAGIMALLELVYNTDIESASKDINFPFEFMFDFRRCGSTKYEDDDVPHYPGVAALHIPLVAHFYLTNGKITQDSFWSLARHFGDRIDACINSPEVYNWIQNEAAKYYNNPNLKEEPGKSPYVLSISNMGRLDGVLNDDISKRIRLVDLHGHSSIMIDQMPLFFFTTFSLNGHICGNVSYCKNYTSDATAAKYVGLIRKYLFNYSNL